MYHNISISTLSAIIIPKTRPGALQNSMAANLEATRLLVNLFASGTIEPGDTAKKWRNHPHYAQVFPEWIRKNLASELLS